MLFPNVGGYMLSEKGS